LNPIGEMDPELYHWFIGDGMVHGIRIRDGRQSGPQSVGALTAGGQGPG
jgi:carotenoid cleavage dioxygenase-like enzyme